jgi:predicted TIM-barrel fold metal-dependent hydrolase
MRLAGVDAAVLIPPSWEGNRNDLVLEAAADYPNQFAAMGRVPLDDPDICEMLATLRSTPGMLGIRVTIGKSGVRSWLSNGIADRAWSAAEAAQIPVMAFIPGTAHVFAGIAARHPGLQLIVDHAGFPSRPDYAPVDEVIGDVLALAEYENIAIKASALPLYVREGYPFPSLHDSIRRLVDAFGPERVFWGGDPTRLPPTCTYREAVDLFASDVLDLSVGERELIMGRALMQWLKWEITQLPSD